jgi:hypothetical protein
MASVRVMLEKISTNHANQPCMKILAVALAWS